VVFSSFSRGATPRSSFFDCPGKFGQRRDGPQESPLLPPGHRGPGCVGYQNIIRIIFMKFLADAKARRTAQHRGNRQFRETSNNLTGSQGCGCGAA
jgi:hypothetical protein